MINLGGRVKPYCCLSINRREDLREEILKEKRKSICMSIWVVHLYYMKFYQKSCKLLHSTCCYEWYVCPSYKKKDYVPTLNSSSLRDKGRVLKDAMVVHAYNPTIQELESRRMTVYLRTAGDTQKDWEHSGILVKTYLKRKMKDVN